MCRDSYIAKFRTHAAAVTFPGVEHPQAAISCSESMVREKRHSKGSRNTSSVFTAGKDGSRILRNTTSRAAEKAPHLDCITPKPPKKNGLQERVLRDCRNLYTVEVLRPRGKDDEMRVLRLRPCKETRHLSAQDSLRFNCRRADSRHPATPHSSPGPPVPPFPYTSALAHLTTSQFLKGLPVF